MKSTIQSGKPDAGIRTSAATPRRGSLLCNRKRTVRSTALAGIVAALASTASAAPSITVDNVVQRWPWNNKLDITYTVSGGQNLAAGVYARIVFTAEVNNVSYEIDGVRDVGASASDGQHTVTWTMPSGLRAGGCTMTATLLSADVPSGDDYMIVDLTKASGNVTWEGLFATQAASNERYNTADYKTDKIVLRKIPRWADSGVLPNAADLPANGYPTGHSQYQYGGNQANSVKTWATARAYYIGVFPITQYQYEKIYGTNPSQNQNNIVEGNEIAHRPVEQVSYDDLRLATTASTSSIPAVVSNSGTFLQRLNFITGNRYGFDLPTDVMFEIASRAGATTAYYWGDVPDGAYIVCSENSGNSTVAVGSRLPNAWGLYDTDGNVLNLCIDGYVPGNMTTRPDAFTPSWGDQNDSQQGKLRRCRGAGYNGSMTNNRFWASYRANVEHDQRGFNLGFRISWIAE